MTSALTHGVPAEPASTQLLRPYQAEAVQAIHAGLAGGGTGQLHAACGSGKTLIGRRAAEELLPSGGTVAILVPSLALVAQTITAWCEHATRWPVRVLAVCSDDTVTDAPVHLSDLHAPATTETAAIAEWLHTEPPAGSALRLIVGTYRSASRLAEAVRGHDCPLDLLILDEAHHLAGRPEYTTRRVVAPGWLPATRRLYMTATPRTDAAAAARHGYLTMDDTDVFGPVLYAYPFARGIAEGYLEDYRVLVVGVRDHDARALLADRDREWVESPGGPPLQTVVAQAALARARQMHQMRRVLTFHNRVEQAAEFARTLPGVVRRLNGPAAAAPHANHVHGGMGHRARRRILDRLRTPPGDWTVISSSRCLGEGVDVPAVDGILFAHPKESAVDIVQAVGRALRPHPDTLGISTIIVPIVVPDEDGEIGEIDPREYATMWRVIRALRAHDEPLGVALNTQRSHLSVDNPGLPGKITVVLPDGTSQDVLDQITLLLVRQTTSVWWEGYSAARAFRDQHGHLDVPQRHVHDGFSLGTWISNARAARRKGWMPAARTEALDKIGMIWSARDAAFEELLAYARAYHAAHGHLSVPHHHITTDGYPLGMRIAVQRRNHSKGDMPAARTEALEALGMLWNAKEARQQELTNAARAYHAAHGHLRVPQTYVDPHGFPLGSTLHTWRKRRTNPDASQSVIDMLSALGMVWNLRDAAWDDGLAACARFREKHGHLRVPKGYVDAGGFKLGDFIAHQRALVNGSKKAEHRPPETKQQRRAALDALGMVWQVQRRGRSATEEEIAALRALPQRHGGQMTEAIARLVDNGVTGTSIAHGLGVHPSAVSARIARWRKERPADPGDA